jgi:hypothetical protein
VRHRRGGVGEDQRVHRRGDVVTPDADGRAEQLSPSLVGIGAVQLPHRRHLRDRHVVEHAEGADDDRGQQQAGKVRLGRERDQRRGLVRGHAAELVVGVSSWA